MDRLLSAGAVVPMALTLGAFIFGLWVSRLTRGNPLTNPVLVAIVLVILFLSVAHMPYQRYFEGAQFINFLLGPAVVALAVPLFRHIDRVRKAALPILAGVVVGSAVAVLSAVIIARLFGLDAPLTASLATRSITAPVAMGVAERIGGVPSLAAVFAVLTGVIGAAFGPLLLNLLRVRDSMVRGLAMGTTSHGIGTARILQDSEEAGAYSSLAMGLTALSMAMTLPLLKGLFT